MKTRRGFVSNSSSSSFIVSDVRFGTQGSVEYLGIESFQRNWEVLSKIKKSFAGDQEMSEEERLRGICEKYSLDDTPEGKFNEAYEKMLALFEKEAAKDFGISHLPKEILEEIHERAYEDGRHEGMTGICCEFARYARIARLSYESAAKGNGLA